MTDDFGYIQITPSHLVAEIGCNHLGDADRSVDLLNIAAQNGADYVKFQKRNPEISTPVHMKHKPHPNQKFAHGETYLEHRRNLELPIEDHEMLLYFCAKNGVGYGCSVYDLDSAEQICNLRNDAYHEGEESVSFATPAFIKIPSAKNKDRELIDYVHNNFDNDLHISTGMMDFKDIISLKDTIKSYNDRERFVIYHCTSEYPCPFEHMYLKNISVIKNLFADNFGCRVGFSNHGKGIACDVVAYTLGADYIERHFIDDRLIEHTDAAASLEPIGFMKLKRDLYHTCCAMQASNQMTDGERQQMYKLRS